MNKRFLSVLIFALVISGAASFLIYRLVAARLSASMAPPPAEGKVVVAARELQVGTLLKDTDIRLGDWNGAPPKGALTNVQDALNRGVVSPLYEGELVLDVRLAAKGAGAGLAATIPVGMRAVAIRVNEIIGVAGFVVPGMRVDVIISGTPPGGNAMVGTVTKTVLQNIQVLSAGQKIEKTAEGTPEAVNVVNLLVTPEQAETMSLASSQTSVQLVLRNPLDTVDAKTTGTATANLFSGVAFKSGAPAPAQVYRPRPVARPIATQPIQIIQKAAEPITIEIFHGSKKAEAEFKTTVEEKNQ
jgi:pilus assembly protein CpaB